MGFNNKLDSTPTNKNSQQRLRSQDRHNTSQSANSKSRRVEVIIIDTGLPLIINENLLNNVLGLSGAQVIDTFKDFLIRYLKSQEILQRLRPIDIQTLCEYCSLIASFVQSIVPQNSYKRNVVFNILLDIYFNENPKYIKLVSQSNKDLQNMKQPAKDIQKLIKLLKLHQKILNSSDVQQILTWAQKDYLKHYKLFHFQFAMDEGGLDINFNLIIDLPAQIAPLQQANYLSSKVQSIKLYFKKPEILETENDSEEEEQYSFKRKYFQSQKQENILEEQKESETKIEHGIDFQSYIDQKIQQVNILNITMKVEQNIDQKLITHKKEFEDGLQSDIKKSMKK